MYVRNILLVTVDQSHFGDQLNKANEQSSANSFSIVRGTRTRKLDINKIRRLPSGNSDYPTRTLHFLPFSVPWILPKYPTFPASICTSHNFPHSRWPDWKYREKKWKWKNFVEFTQRLGDVMSLTMTEKMGINTVPWGTPLLTLTNS